MPKCRRSTNVESKSQDDNDYEENIKQKILKSSLVFVSQHGWTKEAISLGAESVGYPGIVHGLFPNGGADLVNYFYLDSNKRLVTEMQMMASDPAKKPEAKLFIEKSIESRLRMIVPYLDKWPQALGIMTLPPNVPVSLSNLLTLADDICYYAGDNSVDFAWYTRRIAIGGIYKLTELHLLQDKSEDFANTWSFLSRRLDEAVELQSIIQNSSQMSSIAGETVSATFSTARNILRNWTR